MMVLGFLVMVLALATFLRFRERKVKKFYKFERGVSNDFGLKSQLLKNDKFSIRFAWPILNDKLSNSIGKGKISRLWGSQYRCPEFNRRC